MSLGPTGKACENLDLCMPHMEQPRVAKALVAIRASSSQMSGIEEGRTNERWWILVLVLLETNVCGSPSLAIMAGSVKIVGRVC